MEDGGKENLSAFGLLHPKIQEELYSMRWDSLHKIQVEAIKEIILNKNHLLIAAKTAGGKTEAAFLPILSLLLSKSVNGIFALYISPLKALINDQFERLEILCAKSEIPVHKWHGDVGQNKKKVLLKNPRGVLLITPESIESLFINRPNELHNLFSQLEFIVIDEIHSFIGVERGAHLKSLISRIRNLRKEEVRLAGLSATIGEPKLACDWLLPGKSENFRIIKDHNSEKEIKFKIHGYLRPEKDNEDTEQEDKAGRDLAEDLFRYFGGKTALVFGNSKKKLEYYADLTVRKCEEKRAPYTFRVHHGSLSKVERQETEEDLKEKPLTTVFCSSTLEMGIDVGDISIVGQLDPPWSVSSLVQRLGRSGRKDHQPSIMRMFIVEEKIKDPSLIQQLYCNMLQAIAMSELMIEEWCEPPDNSRLHFSTLIHQILSVVKQHGGASPDLIFNLLIKHGSFVETSKKEFISILKSMGEDNLLEQVEDGDLILGLRGEKIVNHYSFYSAFLTAEEFRVVCQSKMIGAIPYDPSLIPDSFLILAGRRWKILDVDTAKKSILVESAKGAKLPEFPRVPGADIHGKVRRKMLQILKQDNIPRYLDDVSKNILAFARNTTSELNQANLINEGKELIWFTWVGSRVNRTLMGLGKFFGKLDVEDAKEALIFSGTNIDEIKKTYKNFLVNCPTVEMLAGLFPELVLEKYDEFLPSDLLAKAFAKNYLDLVGALEAIRSMDN